MGEKFYSLAYVFLHSTSGKGIVRKKLAVGDVLPSGNGWMSRYRFPLGIAVGALGAIALGAIGAAAVYRNADEWTFIQREESSPGEITLRNAETVTVGLGWPRHQVSVGIDVYDRPQAAVFRLAVGEWTFFCEPGDSWVSTLVVVEVQLPPGPRHKPSELEENVRTILFPDIAHPIMPSYATALRALRLGTVEG